MSPQVQPQGSAYLNVRETARLLDIHPNTVRNWVERGILRPVSIPGSRFHKFDARDVARLVKDRGAAVSSVGPDLRTIGPELIDASQLSAWAGSRQAQERFPELIRRLLAATSGITDVSVRAGDGVYGTGWDGTARSMGSNFLPAGDLYFEFGTDADPSKKASSDFVKRPGPSSGIFVFATPKRWARSSVWVERMSAVGKFAAVKVLDADSLEGWLQDCPSVHYWLSEILGRHPEGAQTLEAWRKRFASSTMPELPRELFTAGRSAQQETLMSFLQSDENAEIALNIRANWQDEAVAFIDAALWDSPTLHQRAVVVTSAGAWRNVVQSHSPQILIPTFGSVDITEASRRDHRVLLPMGLTQRATGGGIELTKPQRDVAADALKDAAGHDLQKAYLWAALARRSMPALLRLLARDKRLARPDWSNDAEAVAVFAPLMLAGVWSSREGDIDAIEALTGVSWSLIERQLKQWARTEDPPFIHSGKVWRLASPEEASLMLFESLTSSDMQRWRDVASQVLLDVDPRLELPEEERIFSGIRGIEPKYSQLLRTGVAEGAALLGLSQDAIGDGSRGAEYAKQMVEHVLGSAREDTSGQVTRSLSDVLPLLAEAAPSSFLDFVEADLDQTSSTVMTMFIENESSFSFGPQSSHASLLWSLELLAWSDEYFTRGVGVLARLASIDPGGRSGNRPLGSLTSIFLPWIRNTSASTASREQTLRAVADAFPVLSWPLLISIWPSFHGNSFPPHAPKFRDWLPSTRTYSLPDRVSFVELIVNLAVGMAHSNFKRWCDLVVKISPLPAAQRTQILDQLESDLDDQAFETAARTELWAVLRDDIARHERFPDSDWSLGSDDLGRLRAILQRIVPQESWRRHVYLFDWHPDLPDVEIVDDLAAYERVLEQMRGDAVREILKNGWSADLEQLASHVKVPSHLGWAIAAVQRSEFDANMLSWFKSESPSVRRAAGGWAGNAISLQGASWMMHVLDSLPSSDHATGELFVACAPSSAAFWNVLDGTDFEDCYWASLNAYQVPDGERAIAIRSALEHNQPWIALTLLSLGVDKLGAAAIDLDLAVDVLDQLLAHDDVPTDYTMAGYELGKVLDAVGEVATDAGLMVRFEFAFYQLLNHQARTPTALFKALGESCELFVELVSRVYRGKSEPISEHTEEERQLANYGWTILQDWNRMPGARDDGSVDGQHLSDWVKSARFAFSTTDRVDIGDEEIGSVLANSPTGSDAIWPAEDVRELVEIIGSQSLESGIYLGVRNRRGVTTRGVFDGGQLERGLAEKYKASALRTAVRWPRTSKILRDLAEAYEEEARRNDAEADRRGDAR